MLSRFITEKVVESLAFMPIVLLRGPRQSGKTTLVKKFSAQKQFNYVTFDDLASFVAAKDDPAGFISGISKPVILDEIQRVPELFLPIKKDVDENRVAGRYLLTGSADPLLMPKLGDSLAGRMRLINLWPLSQGEIAGHQESLLERLFSPNPGFKEVACSKEDLLLRASKGGYPTAFLLDSDKQRHIWFNDYVTLVLQKDVLELSRIENMTHMPHLLMLLAARIGGLLNSEELSRTLKFSAPTLQRYLDLLKTLFLVYLLPAWSGNLGKRLVKSPKVYLNDTALQLFLLNLDRERVTQDSHLFGKILENFVVMEILKQISWSDRNIQMFHYRDYQHAEVDLVLEGPGGDLVALEIKSSQTLSSSDFKGLKNFQESVGDKLVQGVLLYTGSAVLPFGQKLTALPVSSLWS